MAGGAVRTTVSMTISVPLGLKARMEAMGREVNWSKAACAAFEREVGRRRGAGDDGQGDKREDGR
jgi:hypothetical protein